MRMRFKPYAHDELMAADFHVHEPLIWGGKWHAQYARPEQPFVLELGCGKGGFISQLACAHPENNYLGIDITDKVLILAQLQHEGLLRAGILAVPFAAPDKGVVDVKIGGHQFVVGIGLETHSHKIVFSL